MLVKSKCFIYRIQLNLSKKIPVVSLFKFNPFKLIFRLISIVLSLSFSLAVMTPAKYKKKKVARSYESNIMILKIIMARMIY